MLACWLLHGRLIPSQSSRPWGTGLLVELLAAACYPNTVSAVPLLMRCSGGRQLQPLHQSPLHVAAESGDVELAEMLLR
jgi:hypothetical protein